MGLFNCLEILYYICRASKTPGGLCAWNTNWSALSYMEARYISAIRELHYASHYSQYSTINVQGAY